jgi:hypothetical protein
MSKLEGNNRWSGKMLLTEHQEQYDKRNAPKLVGKATTEELQLIRDWIILPYMMTMADKGLQEAKRRNHLFQRLFIRGIQIVLDSITRDMMVLRRELAYRQIKVWDDITQDDIVYCKYVCRGYEDRFGITREVLRAEIAKKFGLYIDQIFNKQD